MATIKSYTDIEQSKKLAEILPIESADMYWKNGVSDKYIQCFTPFVTDDYRSNVDYDYDYDVPCWSLAALLNVLPQFIEFKGDKYYLGFMKEYIEYANDEISLAGRFLHTTGNNNLVDACYEMIIRLNELNLL